MYLGIYSKEMQEGIKKSMAAHPEQWIGIDSWAEGVYDLFMQNAPIEDEEEYKDSSCQTNNPK